MAERAFRVITGDGELDDTQAVLPADYALLVEECRKLLREKAALKAQLTKLTKVDPQAPVIEGLLVYWRNTLRGPESRVEIPLDGKRADVVRKTIKRLIEADEDPELASPDKKARAEAVANATDRAAERIRTAIDGCAKAPFEGSYGKRYPEPGPGIARKDDIVYILRDEIKLEKFAKLREGDEKRIAYAHDLHDRLKRSRPLREVLASMNPEYPEILARAIRWCQAQ